MRIEPALRVAGHVCLTALDLYIDFLILVGEDRKIKPTKRVAAIEKYKGRLFREQGGRCRYCGASKRMRNLQIEHLDPVVRGGSNDYQNLQLTCAPCNQRKGMQTDAEFRRRYRSLLPAGRRIPQSPIPQTDFKAVTQRTTESEEVKAFRKTKYFSPRERVGGGATATGVAVAIVLFLLLSSAGLSDLPLLFLALLGGGVVGGGIFLRASHTGKLVDV